MEDKFNQRSHIPACGHSFCKGCIDEWAKKSSNTCPLCKTKFETLSVGGDIIKVENVEKRNINAITSSTNRVGLIRSNVISNLVRRPA